MHAESVSSLELLAVSAVHAVVFSLFAIRFMEFFTLTLFALFVGHFTYSLHCFAIICSVYAYFLIRFYHLALDLLLVVEQLVGPFLASQVFRKLVFL